jgi:hypothetical protein
MNLTKKDIIHSFNFSKRKAIKAFNKNHYEKSLNYIRIAANIAYNFNWIYCDDDLEILLSDISQTLIDSRDSYTIVKNNRVVFYDSFSLDNKGLTQQYIRALISANIEILYLTESTKLNSNSKDIFRELEEYDKAVVIEIPQDIERIEQIKLIYNSIISYHPSKLFMHLLPGAVSAITAFYALPKEITKYQINLTDHAFWLGNRCLDYSLEFRPRGCTLSNEKRGLNKNQLLLQPFYPVVSKSSFRGFPLECTSDKVIIFSGGAFYKVFGDNGEFFILVKQILEENENVVFLFAGTGDSYPLDNFIKLNGFESRFILLGHRSDINEVFRNCDIYMGTYPIGGGLMSQYAAMNAKPILNYMPKDGIGSVEDFVCQNQMCSISFTEKDKFFAEAKHFITDANYRSHKGNEIKACLITKEQFNDSFLHVITSNENQKQYKDVKIEYESIFDQYIETENKFQNNYKLLIIKSLRLRIFFLSPKIIYWFFLYILSKRGFDKIKGILKK